MPTPSATAQTYIGASEYSDVSQDNTFEDRQGLIVVPRAAPGATPKVVKLHEAYGVRRVAWSVSRSGRPPVAPAAGNLINDTYISGSVDMPLPTPNDSTGGFNFALSGEYVYLQGTNRRIGEAPLPTGSYPYDNPIQDSVAATILVNAPSLPSGADPITFLVPSLGQSNVDHAKLFPWPFTVFPTQCGTTGLIGG